MFGQMYDPALKRVLLNQLVRWGRVTASDLVQMLPPGDRLRYRPDVLLDLQWEGLVDIAPSGDEPVVSITPRGLEAAGVDASTTSHA